MTVDMLNNHPENKGRKFNESNWAKIISQITALKEENLTFKEKLSF
jgi:hypothetical protein